MDEPLPPTDRDLLDLMQYHYSQIREHSLSENPINLAYDACLGCRATGETAESIRHTWGQVITRYNLTVEQLADEVLAIAESITANPDNDRAVARKELDDVRAAIAIIKRDGVIIAPRGDEPRIIGDDGSQEYGGVQA